MAGRGLRRRATLPLAPVSIPLPANSVCQPRAIAALIAIYGLANALVLDQRQISRRGVGLLESSGLDGKRGFFFAVLRAMVGHGENPARRRSERILVA